MGHFSRLFPARNPRLPTQCRHFDAATEYHRRARAQPRQHHEHRLAGCADCSQRAGSSSRRCLGGVAILLGQHVRVDVEGEGHRRVAQPARDDARVDAARKRQRGVAVAQAVQRDLRQSGRLEMTLKALLTCQGCSGWPSSRVKTKLESTQASCQSDCSSAWRAAWAFRASKVVGSRAIVRRPRRVLGSLIWGMPLTGIQARQMLIVPASMSSGCHCRPSACATS